MDWSGSARMRKPQGICLPPSRPAVKLERFVASPGTPCQIRPVSQVTWRPFRTTKRTGFERFERYAGHSYEFRDQGWMMRVARRYVRCRDEEAA